MTKDDKSECFQLHIDKEVDKTCEFDLKSPNCTEKSDEQCDYDLKTPPSQTTKVSAFEHEEDISSKGSDLDMDIFCRFIYQHAG